MREIDKGALEKAESVIKEKDEKIRQLTDQLAWYRRKFWKPISEKYIPQDPNQRKIDFEGLDVLPEEEEAIKEAAKEIISYERKKPEKPKKQPIRLPIPDYLRREEEIIEPEGIDENWVRIGEEVTEILEHKPGELYVRRIVRPKYALKKACKPSATCTFHIIPTAGIFEENNFHEKIRTRELAEGNVFPN